MAGTFDTGRRHSFAAGFLAVALISALVPFGLAFSRLGPEDRVMVRRTLPAAPDVVLAVMGISVFVIVVWSAPFIERVANTPENRGRDVYAAMQSGGELDLQAALERTVASAGSAEPSIVVHDPPTAGVVGGSTILLGAAAIPLLSRSGDTHGNQNRPADEDAPHAP